MTCIAAVVHDGAVWMGGDSAGVAGWSLSVRADEKVFVKGDFIFGFTTSFRMGDLIRYSFSPPEQLPSETDDRGYLVTRWMDALRKCFEAGGYKYLKDGREFGGQFLVGYRGRLYNIDNDFQVGLSAEAYDAVGCGQDLALGALYAETARAQWGGELLDPDDAILTALEAAEQHSAGVRGPFTILSGGQA
jgi:hypothetical protein